MPDSKPETLNQSEEYLVERASKGDVEAFATLYKIHLDAIYRYVYFRTNHDKDAEDLTEQVFLNAWEALPGFEQQGKPFTSWIYRIAHNIVIDYYRVNNRRPILVDEIHPDQQDTDQLTALHKVIQKEEHETLAKAISQLPDEQQQVIILRFFEGFSHKEVADVLDKNEGACRMIQFRALQTLKGLLTGPKDGR